MQQEIINRITKELTRSKAINSAYSLRAFSKKIGIQASAISEILNGHRKISKKMGKRILDGLCVNPDESKMILSDNTENATNLKLTYFNVISDWYYFAVLSLAETDEFISDPKWISKRLNIKNREAKKAIETLTKLGMLKKDRDGNLKTIGVQYKTPTDVANISLKNHTIQTLELAKDSLFSDPLEKRDFSTITMAIDPEKISEVKKMIKSFRKKISKKLECGKKKEVYKLSIQLFPLSRNIKENKDESF